MLTVIVKRNQEPTVIQMTQEAIMRELSAMNRSEMLLEDRWVDGIKKVRTPFFCLVEADCTLSGGYLASNLGLMRKDAHNIEKGTGGYLKRAMLASCLGYRSYANRIYSYSIGGRIWSDEMLIDGHKIQTSTKAITPERNKLSMKPYHVEVGFVPGAIIRFSAIKDIIDEFNWDDPDLVKMSTLLSLHFWNTNRRVQVNPNTTYVSNESYLEEPPYFDWSGFTKAYNVFAKEMI